MTEPALRLAEPARVDAAPHDDLVRPLMVLTATTGVIDAVSYVGLGRVFTANMTGNVVFIGFALAGTEEVSMARSLLAMGSFVCGALAGGRVVNGAVRAPVRHLAIASSLEAVLLSIAVGIGFFCTSSPPASLAYALIVLTGLAMGVRNAMVRTLGVLDVTTTVLTLTLTGLAADSSLAGGSNVRRGRRLFALVAMAAGACLGTLLLREWGFAAPLALAAFLAAAVAIHSATRAGGPAQSRPPHQAASR